MSTTYTFEQLKEDVRKEAEALRVHATKEEREKINFKRFTPHHHDGCIYGLATRDCHSDRAVELIQKCCVRYFHGEGFTYIAQEGFEGVAKRANGTTVENLSKYRNSVIIPKYFSAIEAYILLPEARNESLIAYLRGETETLEL